MKEIPLSQGQVALIDDDDFEWLSQWKWYAHQSIPSGPFYAKRNVILPNGKHILERMHRRIVGLEHDDKRHADHINRDTLDNRRENLRIATVTQNHANSLKPKSNTSGYKGVSWHKYSGLWRACITLNRRQIALGYFDSPELAATAYADAAKKLFGEFARP